jgi:hypothetical protein
MKNKNPKKSPKNVCELRHYTTSNKTNFMKHNLTRKYIMTQNDTINPQKSPKQFKYCINYIICKK